MLKINMTAPVFSSDIERIVNPNVSKLYQLLHNEPAIPVLPEKNIESAVAFQPKTGKIYIPKIKPSNMKVKTVANIRQQYEDDVYAYLPDDLVKIEEYFVSKVSSNSSRLDATKRMARKILRSSNSIDRQTWQILANLNPEKKNHPLQYVLWNGVCVRVNGSRGGSTKFLVNCDLYEKKTRSKSLNKKNKEQKKSLLQKSLSVKFKPGPLKKKKILDYSYQKFNVGSTELVKLPQIGLAVQPLYGVPIEPTISQVLFSLCSENGKLTDKWAEFSVSALGEITSTKTTQLETNSVVFELDYKNDQNQILMRSDHRNPNQTYKNRKLNSKLALENDLMITQQISVLVNQMIDYVEINVMQDKYSKYDPDDRLTVEIDLSLDSNGSQTKDKVKKRCGELEKLDVTVIRLPDVDENLNKACEKPYCFYGCICISLEYKHKLKNHCGRPDCMFKCNCDVSKLKNDTSFDGYFDILPGLMNLDSEINAKLAKEEKKFHQTVLLAEDKSFVLKPQRRSTKAPKKYSEFFTDLIDDTKCEKIVTINILKLQCENIEPWCMVHNLYKCFCQGRFTHSSINLAKYNNPKVSAASENLHCTKAKICKEPIIELIEDDSNTDSDLFNANANEARNLTCARIRRFIKRRYDSYHYEKTNKRIEKLEKNDKSLQEKLLKHVKSSLKPEFNIALKKQLSLEDISDSDVAEPTAKSSQLVYKTIPSDKLEQTHIPRNFPDMSKLIKWLEENYKFYKPRLQNGQKRFPLEAPKPGKIALYPWEVILDRYNSKKNYFLITQTKPYRLFMAVDLSDPVFKNCIKIEEVKFEDIPKYPITVRNLLQDASDMTDSFYILCGQSNCWELIGHVTKLGANNHGSNNISLVSGASEKEIQIEIEVGKYKTGPQNDLKENEEESKWFLLLVGNDFKEIQFIYRGFFIKYENIQKAIKVSRLSHKTVRLSSQKSAGFGIHAIPVEEHNCVFIGPYYKDESLGFETIGSSSDSECVVTSKGFWINTDKTSNIDLINNPISFLKDTCERLGSDLESLVTDLKKIKALSEVAAENKPENSARNKKRRLSLDGIEESTPLPKLIKCYENSRTLALSGDKNIEKVVKPITIKKSGSFYKVKPATTIGVNLLDTIKQPLLKSTFAAEGKMESFVDRNPLPIIQNTFSLKENPSVSSLYSKGMHNKPVAEIAPQRKTDVQSNPQEDTSELLPPKEGIQNRMIILNPEEINKRLLENQTEVRSSLDINSAKSNETALEDMDIENFLTTHSVCSPSDDDSEVSVLSEDDCKFNKDLDVMIECKNYDIGWIPGKINKQYQISFALPGFKFSEYYKPREAFAKINQVLSRKVYIPIELELEWEIVHGKHNLNASAILNYDIDIKKILMVQKTKNTATKSSLPPLSTAANAPSTSSDIIEVDTEDLDTVGQVQERTKTIKDLELKSARLESELGSLQSAVLLKKSELLKKLMQVPAESRELMRNKFFKL